MNPGAVLMLSAPLLFIRCGVENMHTDEVPKLISGVKIGRWTVTGDEILAPGGQRKWLCRCDCGTERYVLERSLLYGGSKSCGCLRRERASQALSPDLTGKQFGALTVLRKLENRGGGAVRWLCRCTCGAEYSVQGTLLLNGKRTRCPGRCHQKNYAFSDISGQRFGRLVALQPSRRYDKSGSVIWRCRCDCGKETEVSYNSLMYANQKSCGCGKKEHEQKLNRFLTHVAGTSVDMLRSRKVPSDNTTGYRGVYLVRGKYMAKIVFQKKQYFLGTYEKIEDAAKARKEAEKVLFEDVAEYYEKWKQCADADPQWAEENPIQIDVIRQGDKLDVVLLPDLKTAGSSKR